MRPYIVALTGASGICYGVRTVRALLDAGKQVILVLSESGRLVVREELGISLGHTLRAEDYQTLVGSFNPGQLSVFSPKDFTAPIASGSFPVEGMVIAPCSMGTLGAIASGISQNLIHRAADCMIKEGRRLVMVPRETPLSAIHLENMARLARLGVRMVPAMPGFYSGVRTVTELVDFMTGKILDQLEVDHMLFPRWTGSLSRAGAK